MTYYAGREGDKQDELRAFHTARLLKPDAPPIMGCGEGDERALLEQFGAQGRKRVIQRRFNVGVLETISEKKASTL